MTTAKPTFSIEALAVFPLPGMGIPGSFAFSQDDSRLMYLYGGVARCNNFIRWMLSVARSVCWLRRRGVASKKANFPAKKNCVASGNGCSR
ncbi:MAG: hypothetical protein H6671_06590 [Anaerolineaceae bacterium]|nr:hypothetical protein [Anaerolineaceae bacterium]